MSEERQDTAKILIDVNECGADKEEFLEIVRTALKDIVGEAITTCRLLTANEEKRIGNKTVATGSYATARKKMLDVHGENLRRIEDLARDFVVSKQFKREEHRFRITSQTIIE